MKAEEVSPLQPETTNESKPRSLPFRVLRGLIRYLLPVGLIVSAVVAAVWMVRSSPKAGRRTRKQKRARLVEVTSVESASHRVVVEAMGTVIPARRVTIHPQVQGKVIFMSEALTPGSEVSRGKRLLRIESSDYLLAVRQRQSDLAKARAELAQEKGRQAVAKKEYELLGKKVAGGDRDLMLRKPQLQTAKAAVAAAEAALARARLDLSRTTIRAPFNGVVDERHVNLGSRVTPQSRLVTLVGTDTYWVEVSVPVDELRWISFGDEGTGGEGKEKGEVSQVRVQDPAAWGEGAFRRGRVLKLKPSLEKQGRMARILVEIDDPLALKKKNSGKPKLIVDSYVKVEIGGGRIDSAVALPRKLLRDERTVWVLRPDGKLDIRDVDVAFRAQQRVYVTAGLEEGDRVVVTDLAAPVDGMPLRTDTALTKSSPNDESEDDAPGQRRAESSEEHDAKPASKGGADARRSKRAAQVRKPL